MLFKEKPVALNVIPSLPKTNVNGKKMEMEYRELQNAISGSAHRIHMNYANIEVSAPIIQSMVKEVDKMGHTRTIPFDHKQPVIAE